MARKRPAQVVIDPVAAAQQLQPEEPSTAQQLLLEGVQKVERYVQRRQGQQENLPPGVVQTAVSGHLRHCALGHENMPDARFCAACGLTMDAQAPVKVDLDAARPRPAGELSGAERAERDRQHTEAIAAARAFENAPVTYVPAEGTAVLIHFIEDGLTAFGQVWYRGQELEIGPSHPRWEQARGWILLDRMAQVERYGKQFFERGPWPGRRSYLDGADGFEKLSAGRDADGNPVTFSGPGEEALRQADEAERRRGRSVPAPLR